MKLISIFSALTVIGLAHAAQAGSFACVQNNTTNPKTFLLSTADSTPVTFTVPANDNYCQEMTNRPEVFVLDMDGDNHSVCDSVRMSPKQWLVLKPGKKGQTDCEVFGDGRTEKPTLKASDTRITVTFLDRRVKKIEQYGPASNCADAPPYRWDKVGDHTSITMRINHSGSCFFELSKIFLRFFIDNNYAGEARCAQGSPGWNPTCDIVDQKGEYLFSATVKHTGDSSEWIVLSGSQNY